MDNKPVHLSYTSTQRAVIIGSCILGFALDLYDVLILPYVMPAIQKTLGFSLTEVASITSITLIGSVIGGAGFGVIGDRLGRKTALQLTLLLFGLGSIGAAFAWDYWSLAILRFATGIGLGGEWGAGMVLFSEAWNPKRRGLGSAFIQGSAVLATAGAPIVGIWVLGAFSPDWGWRVGLLTGAAPLALIVVVRWWMPESKAWQKFDADRRSAPAADKVPLATLFTPRLRKVTILSLLWVTSYMFYYYGIAVFMPTLMLKTLQTPPDIVRTTSVISSVAGGFTYVVMGLINDRYGRRYGAILPNIMTLASIVGLLLWGHVRYEHSILEWPIFWITMLFAVGAVSIGVIGTWLSELFPIEVRSTAVSSVYMAGRALGGLAPIAVPAFAAAYGGDIITGFWLCLVTAVLFFVLSWMLPETMLRNRRKAEADTPADRLPLAMSGSGATEL